MIMNLQRIEILIEKYEKGKTSVKEEAELKEFFARDNVPFHLRSYKDLFTFFEMSAKEEIPGDDFDERILKSIGEDGVILISQQRNRYIYIISGIAASIIILFGLYFQFGLMQLSLQRGWRLQELRGANYIYQVSNPISVRLVSSSYLVET